MMTRYRLAAVIALVMYLAAFFPPGKKTHTCTCRHHSSDCPCCRASVAGPMGAPQVPSKPILLCQGNRGTTQKFCGPGECKEKEYHSNNTENSEPKLSRCCMPPKKEGYSKKQGQRRPELSGSCNCKEKKDQNFSIADADLIKLEMIGLLSNHDKFFCYQKGLLLPGNHRPLMKPPPV